MNPLEKSILDSTLYFRLILFWSRKCKQSTFNSSTHVFRLVNDTTNQNSCAILKRSKQNEFVHTNSVFKCDRIDVIAKFASSRTARSFNWVTFRRMIYEPNVNCHPTGTNIVREAIKFFSRSHIIVSNWADGIWFKRLRNEREQFRAELCIVIVLVDAERYVM